MLPRRRGVLSLALVLLVVWSFPVAAESSRDRRRRNTSDQSNRRQQEEQRARDQKQTEAERKRQKRNKQKVDERRRKELQKASLSLLKELFKKAQAAEKEERWTTAYHHYYDVSLARTPGSKKLVADSSKKVAELKAKAAKLFRTAKRRQSIGRYVEAAEIYMQLLDDFEYFEHNGQVRARLRVLKRNPRSGAAIMLAEAQALEKAGTFLFSVAWGDFKDAFEKGALSEGLRDEFAEHESTLSDSAMIEPQEEGKTWQITADDKVYVAEKAGGTVTISAGDYPKAATAYEQIIKKFPDQIAAIKARGRLEAFKRDPEISAALAASARAEADAMSPKWLGLAKNYIMNHRYNQARRYLRKVIDNYPGTEWAETAREKLAALP